MPGHVLTWSACRVCGSPLASDAAGLTCTDCGERLPAREGVVVATGALATSGVAQVDEVREAFAAARDGQPAVRPAGVSPDTWRWACDLRVADAVLLLPSLTGRRALVVGCGAGLHAALLAFHGADVVAVDHRLDCARLAAAALRAAGHRVTVFAGRCANLPLARGAFDVVVAPGPLELPGDDRQASGELVSALAFLGEDGTVVAGLPGRHGAPRRRRALVRALQHRGLAVETVIGALPERRFPRYLVEGAGSDPRGLAFVVRELTSLGLRGGFLGRLQPVLAHPAVARRASGWAPRRILFAARRPRATADGPRVVLSGYRPFGDVAVVAELAPDGTPAQYRKVARMPSACDKLRTEHDGTARARTLFGEHVVVARTHQPSERELVSQALVGARLTTILAGPGSARAAGDAAARILDGVAATVRERAVRVPYRDVVYDPVLSARENARVAELAAAGDGGGAMLVGPAHGDLQVSNVVVLRGGGIGVIDWEYLAMAVPVAFDACFLLAAMTRFMRPSPTTSGAVPIADGLMGVLERYAEDVGLGRDGLAAYLPVFVATSRERAASFDDLSRPRPPSAATSAAAQSHQRTDHE